MKFKALTYAITFLLIGLCTSQKALASEACSSFSSSSSSNSAARGYAGLGIRELALNGSGKEGVLVSRVVPNGPGAAAGLEQGDVIEEINGQPIIGLNDFWQKTGVIPCTRGWGVAPGTTVQLRVNRGGQLREIALTLGQMPAFNNAAGTPAASNYAASNSLASPLPGRLSGIFRASVKEGTDPTASLPIGDLAAKTPAYSYLVFFPSGRVKRGLVTSGLDHYNDEASMRRDVASGGNIATQWGMYKLSGDHGKIVFASAMGGVQLVRGLNGEVWDVALYPDRLQINGDSYVLMDSGRSRKLEGTYKPLGDMKQPGITFTSDGEFVDEGILNYGAIANIKYGGGTGVAIGYKTPDGGSGTFRVSNYGLTLNYANSAPEALFFLDLASSNGQLQNIYINNVRYQRVR